MNAHTCIALTGIGLFIVLVAYMIVKGKRL